MNITISTNKTTAFFYWLQTVSGWDETAATDDKTLAYYRSFIPNDDATAKSILQNVKNLLQGCSDPRRLLGKVYAGNFSSGAAQKLKETSLSLQSYFDKLWLEQFDTLEQWRELLERYDFARFDGSFAKVAGFLESSFDLQAQQTIYLLPNAPGKNTIGHRISSGDFILLRPPIDYDPDRLNGVICVVIHEMLHAVEFGSKTTRKLMKQAYETQLKPHSIPAPTGYTWKMMFFEAIVYCFANNITGGYLRPQIFGKAKPTMDEFEQKVNHFFEQNGLKTGHVLAWVGLCILPLVDELMNEGEAVNQKVFDKMGVEFYKKYLTKKTLK
jgi:hypothetical protein